MVVGLDVYEAGRSVKKSKFVVVVMAREHQIIIAYPKLTMSP
jgi:hypothetical protein